MEKTSTTATTKKRTATDQSMLLTFFLEELRDIYGAEKLLIKLLPKLEKAATSEDLKTALADHLEITENHVKRLEQIFQLFGENPRIKKCEGMEGLVKESQTVIEATEEGTFTRDVGLIISAQKAEHYEISAYGSLAQLAKTLGRDDVTKILAETLKEEKQTDVLLTKLAESYINQEARQEVDEP